MVQAWGISLSILTPGWSISTELAAYIAFPIFVILLSKYKNHVGHLIACSSFAIIFILSQSSLGSFYNEDNVNNLNIWQGNTPYPLIRCLCEFAIGVLAYRLYIQSSEDKHTFSKLLQSKLLSSVLGILLIICLCVPLTDALIVLIIPFFIISLADDKSPVARFIGWKPIYFLGVISYSLYLCHLMTFWIKPELAQILVKIEMPNIQFTVFIIQIITSLIIATLLYFCVEKPGRILFKKILESSK
jgi:peptidoglycan/LPS O-acetylase OafA/YrhL